MRRNNLARNLERFEAQKEILLTKNKDDDEQDLLMQLVAAKANREFAMNKAYAKSLTAYDEGYNQAIRKRILFMLAIGLLLAGVLGAMS